MRAPSKKGPRAGHIHSHPEPQKNPLSFPISHFQTRSRSHPRPVRLFTSPPAPQNAMSSAVWPAPNDWSSRAPVTAAYLAATCVLSAFVAKRITTFAAFRTLSLARALVVLVLVESLLFILVNPFRSRIFMSMYWKAEHSL